MDYMDKKALEAFARETAKSIKTESDLDDYRKMLTKVTIGMCRLLRNRGKALVHIVIYTQEEKSENEEHTDYR